MDILTDIPSQKPAGNAFEVFLASLMLGLTSFGGPVAHIGYFENSYVHKKSWLSREEFTGLLALCQIIPGPASSQLGYLIGLKRAGWSGALAAWLGFTLPSALIMFGFALLAPDLKGPMAEAVLHGLRLVAVVVVAQAVWSMGRTMCPDWQRIAIALIAALMLLNFDGQGISLAVLLLGASGGIILCRHIATIPGSPSLPVSRRAGILALGLFLALLTLTFSPLGHGLLALAAIFYRSGALVFGGGHVVLPLLRGALVPAGWLRDAAFVSGYGAVQAMPGPLFTFAAYLGAVVAPHGSGLGHQALWSATALLFLFLPGLLIAVASVSVWSWLGHHPLAKRALMGINAAVVGILAAAFVTPVWTSAITAPIDFAIAGVALVLLVRFKTPPIVVVCVCVGCAFLFR